MSPGARRVAFACALACASSAWGAARAEEADVEARFRRGVELYNEADFRSAAAEFRRAHEASGNYKILFNLAQCEHQLTEYAAAYATLERYLAEAGARLPDARRREVDDQLDELRARTAAVTLVSSVDGALLALDGRDVGTSPLASPVRIDAGTHRAAARRTGFVEASVTFHVTSGEAREVRLAPEAAPSPAPRAEPSPRAAPPPRDRAEPLASYTPALVAWGAAAAFGIAAGLTGAAASAKSDELSEAKASPTATASGLRDLDAATGRFALATDVFLGAAIVGAGLASYLTLDVTASRRAAGRPRTAGVRAFPTVGGVGLGGSF